MRFFQIIIVAASLFTVRSESLAQLYSPYVVGSYAVAGVQLGGPLREPIDLQSSYNPFGPATIYKPAGFVDLDAGVTASAESFAYANLQTGTLETKTAGTFSIPGFSEDVASATISDAFYTADTNGSPFVWSDSTLAHFILKLDGMSSGSGNFDANIFAPNWLLSLDITKAGDAEQSFPFSEAYIGQQFSPLGPVDQVFQNKFGIFSAVKITGDLSTELTVDMAFKPDGDFQWSLRMLNVAALDDGLPTTGYTWDTDFSHTVHVGYLGPEGTLTYSANGLPSTLTLTSVPVPEPSAYGLMGSALLLGSAILRRRFRSGRKSF